MISNAVGSDRVSSVVGYVIKKGDFRLSSPNLPQRVVILGEANTANQATLSNDATEITSAQQAGELYGYGSPIHMAMRILRPRSGDGIGGIPTIVYAQDAAIGSTAQVYEITPSGVATANGTHTLVVAGRRNLDGVSYDVNINEGDTATEITQKIEDAINNVLGCPFTATSNGYDAELTSKWTGLTAAGLTLSVDTNGNDLGITYAFNETSAGSGTPSVQTALDDFGNDWNTIVVNLYGTVTSVMDALEAFNGIADPNTPTGRYSGIIMKPFVALTGSVADDPSLVTSARKNQMTIAICPAPLSAGHPLEAAANGCALLAPQAQNTPHLDVQDRFYPDMPAPLNIGLMTSYNERDRIVKNGSSTVVLESGRYKVIDFVTTYHPLGENPPQFRYVRSLIQDWNVRYGYYLLEKTNVVGKAIAGDDDVVTVSDVIKPKQWKGILFGYAEDLSRRGLVADASFMQQSVEVGISTTNPERLETFFRYKRTGFARIAATDAQAGFNFGTN
jgi:phage tail sheath gpL-like